ncbi:hypothetical protein [Aurantivibrio plasticivorans]
MSLGAQPSVDQSRVSGSVLPGGIIIDGSLRKDFCFKPVLGEMELVFSDALVTSSSFPSMVTSVLQNSLESIAGESPTRHLVQQLSVGDRQFLMRQLAAHVNDQETWVSANCRACGETMDLSFRYSELPIKEASENYPGFTYECESGQYEIRVPIGEDQEVLASINGDGLELLLNRVIAPVNGSKILALSNNDLEGIEAAIEDASPEVGNRLLAYCPHCEVENTVEVDLYGFLSASNSQLLIDVHQIATHYHWSEDDILKLPTHRRKQYLAMIDRSRGMTGGENIQ